MNANPQPESAQAAPDRRRVAMAVAILAVLFGSLLIVRTSSAAFTATTDNTGNSVIAGDVVLGDDDSGTSPMFTETAFGPGETATACIEVTYDGTIPDPQAVQLYSGGYTDVAGPDAASTGLSDHLLLTIEQGTNGTFGNCSSFVSGSNLVTAVPLSTFDATNADYASGVGTFDPSATGQSASYRFTITLDNTSVPNEEQGASTTDIAFIWEVTS